MEEPQQALVKAARPMLAPPSAAKRLRKRRGGTSGIPECITLSAESLAFSESAMKALVRKNVTPEFVAWYRGNTPERVVKSVPYPETSRLSSSMLFVEPPHKRHTAGTNNNNNSKRNTSRNNSFGSNNNFDDDDYGSNNDDDDDDGEITEIDGEPVRFTTQLPAITLLRTHFQKEGKLTNEAAYQLLRRARRAFAAEPNLLEIPAPTVVCGDLHGQFHDMLSIFEIAGDPERIGDWRYLFLGDYVDRGFFSTEVVLYLCALKLAYPKRIYLLRGNHETRLMCEFMTFCKEVLHKYNRAIYDEFQRLFEALPIAAVIENTSNGNCFCVHGGIGPDLNTLDDIRAIDRFCEIPKKSLFWDLVWADPLPEWDDEVITVPRDEWERSEFSLNTFRHSSYLYGLAAVEKFLRRNDLCCIIRGHQVQQNGYFEHFTRCEKAFPIAPVLTVFSAPNYCDQYVNRAAFLQIMPEKFMVQQFFDVEHPYVLADFTDAISWSLPFLLENIVSVLQQLVLGFIQDGAEDLSPEERAADDALAEKTKALYAKSKRIKEQRDKFMRVNDESYHKNMSLFEEILKRDLDNEACPLGPPQPFKRCSSDKSLKGGSSFALVKKKK